MFQSKLRVKLYCVSYKMKFKPKCDPAVMTNNQNFHFALIFFSVFTMHIKDCLMRQTL